MSNRDQTLKGENHGSAKITEKQAIAILEDYAKGIRRKHISAKYGVNEGTVSHIALGRIWKHLEPYRIKLNIQRRSFLPKRKKHPYYIRWLTMRDRCNNPKNKNYKHYGGRGITVCERWNEFWSYVEDIGISPGPEYSIDRIDNDKGYSKENCRWATSKQQAENRRDVDRCRKGHPWTIESTMHTQNGKHKIRKCKICYDNRIK